ncbi:sterol desaturase family protein [Chitinophaga pinensis]|uniref:Fatty acid hydroxylase n=1 Tax=Chitinophaga pinensis (strain ATCC 43595 / DSM 2588 / LMG 13176 / NBRC 15968 / NCIMB 11800 / UQM 2034) TaxID=485918 RepID=A0A979G8T0_CHIPD|nr:sterol desaturase family protein [Chitinophaga pinensis]ACU63044.1 fatty acid hydroxylase [Chitinophaga pinensis DSM 2588]
MLLLSYILAGLGAFVFMEMVAWFTHKYIMHGFLWSLHKDHHRKEEGQFFEKNDFFFVIFALPGMLLFLFGTLQHLPYLIAIATGITLYGATYFLVHDVFVHQRFRWLRQSDNIYLRALRRAHKMHHKHLGKEKGECFGMLFFPVRFLRDAFNKEKSYS